MSFEGLCRIPGSPGYFEISYRAGQLQRLKPVRARNLAGPALWLTPGLFDIQANGMLGHDLSSEELTLEHVAAIDSGLESHGVLLWCPTICTQEAKIVARNLALLRQAIEGREASHIYGLHLEGHYISAEEGYRGVHLPRFIRDPDPQEFDRWQEAAGGHIRLFSLAPERGGALQFIEKLRAQNTKIGLVHHHADHDTVRAAVAAGADLSSHLINGCFPLIHRQHNIIWSQLSLDDLWASFIADGYHIPSYTLRAVIKSKGLQKSILISDISHLSGMPDGEYEANGMKVILKNGGLWVKEKGTDLLSGAAKTLEQDVEYLAANSGFSIEEAFIMATINPARYFGIEHSQQLYQGRKGPLVVFSWAQDKLSVVQVLK